MVIFNRTAHKELWQWLADHPEMEKSDWPGWQDNGGKYRYHMNWCFACEATVGYDGSHHCGQCPFQHHTNTCLDGFYHMWTTDRLTRNYDSRVNLAKRIRDWPVREGVICK